MAAQRRREEMEARAAETAQALFAQHERERTLAEGAALLRQHDEFAQRAAEASRVAEERAVHLRRHAQRELRVSIAVREAAAAKRLANISVTSPLPDARRIPDVLEYVDEIRSSTAAAASTEAAARDVAQDVARVDGCVAVALAAMDARDAATTQAERDAAEEVYNAVLGCAVEVVDAAVADVMMYLDRIGDAEDDSQAVAACWSGVHSRVGLWGGNRLPRVRNVDLSGAGVLLAPRDGGHLPREMNLLAHGVRVAYLAASPHAFAAANPVGPLPAEYAAVGGAFFVDLTPAPAAPKHVREWTLRIDASLARTLPRAPYPPPAERATAPPIRVSLVLPACVVVRHAAPIVGLWNAQQRRWLPSAGGGGEFAYDAAEHRATFAAEALGTFAVIVERVVDLPFDAWTLQPVSPTAVMFEITPRSRPDVAPYVLRILFERDQCCLVAPALPGLAAARDVWQSPAQLLARLADSGFMLTLPASDAALLPGVVQRAAAMEEEVADELAWLASSFAFSSSAHRRAAEISSMALFRVSAAPAAPPPDEPHPASSWEDQGATPPPVAVGEVDAWLTVRYEHGKVVLCAARDDSPPLGGVEAGVASAESVGVVASLLAPLPGRTPHATLANALEAELPDADVSALVDRSDPLLVSALRQFLRLIRPLTYG